MMVTHAKYSLQLIVESFYTGAKQVASTSVCIDSFKLIVNFILASEGEHATKPNGLVNCNNLVYIDDHISLVGPIKLVKLIGCVGHTNNFVGPSQLIV